MTYEKVIIVIQIALVAICFVCCLMILIRFYQKNSFWGQILKVCGKIFPLTLILLGLKYSTLSKKSISYYNSINKRHNVPLIDSSMYLEYSSVNRVDFWQKKQSGSLKRKKTIEYDLIFVDRIIDNFYNHKSGERLKLIYRSKNLMREEEREYFVETTSQKTMEVSKKEALKILDKWGYHHVY